ncbi:MULTISPECIES: NUDIX hydrolase [unclassified Fusibacter]|uniref:NUDIX hydrolase n=1 Tax=unclassified Fusibacter TaxID=2624464 RepID=UPI001011E363|nr:MULTISPECIES: NUDIX hydrolase [unclassified Fusibacter]MCK8061040.1 NUDIX hydrolase [Fusibacter sp. A2]NPE20506.1 NUDIX hydrolase [Fusibacter sp. A1]RXV63706.1 NUDIX hydrolase [Fusibacter sp. A1]
MREENSAGGVVFFGNTVLLLMKMNGDWVLPKGRIEENELKSETALREVLEETGVKAEILEYVGDIHYTYKNYWTDNHLVDKTVSWYLMTTQSMRCVPQREEGFKAARFIHMNKAAKIIKYDDERNIIEKSILAYTARYYRNNT